MQLGYLRRLEAIEEALERSWYGLPDEIVCTEDEEPALVARWDAAHPVPRGYRPGIDGPRLVVIVIPDEGED